MAIPVYIATLNGEPVFNGSFSDVTQYVMANSGVNRDTCNMLCQAIQKGWRIHCRVGSKMYVTPSRTRTPRQAQ
jgi:hypothetical protein